jgi:hypothetical protein
VGEILILMAGVAMAVTTTVDHVRRRVSVRADGPITLADILVHIESEQEEVGLPYEELIDARGYVPAFSSAEVHVLVSELRHLAHRGPLGPTAVVADSLAGYGMVRMIEVLAEDFCEIRPFRTVEEAETWLAEVGPSAS